MVITNTATRSAPKTTARTRTATATKATRRRREAGRLTARTADKFELYEQSVQCVEADVRFLDRVFRKMRGEPPISLREDFCGTARLCSCWVESARNRQAIGVDLDRETLEWAARRNVETLGSRSNCVTLLSKDVRDIRRPKVNVICAFNFSYFIFRERDELVGYFKNVRRSLADDGIFVVDLYGGPDAQSVGEEETSHGRFTYVWDQASFNPIDNHAVCNIHFRFRDGSMIRRAFSYDWRLWSLPEIRDVLHDAGFSTADAYWEGTDEDGDGNGVFRKTVRAENCDSWIAYLVAGV